MKNLIYEKDTWLLLNRAAIIIYCIMYFVENNLEEKLFVLFILIYICLSVFTYFFKRKIYKISLNLISIIFLVLSTLNISVMLILFLPINIFELSELIELKTVYSLILVLVIGIYIRDSCVEINSQFLIIGILSYLIFQITLLYDHKLAQLRMENDILKEKNYDLLNKLHNDKEYEDQIIYTSQLEERNKIAQVLHDKLGHTIAGSTMQLEASKLIMDKDKEKSRGMIENVIKILREGMDEIRITLKDLKPPSEQLGINKVKLLLESTFINTNIEYKLIYYGDLEQISYIEWKVIYDTVKEACTNTLKYAKASSVTASIEVLNKYIKLEVKDNGIGQLIIKKGLGIKGIEERCQNVGGKVIVDGSKGFSLIVLIPK